ncbi:hypothetical protein KL942_000216 [Ogataea angusta]|uniref:Uncharacterized protein n=1 Tax=Pichia angusta TaxID=870730 RepID=A0AAN6DK31_PICAN|nr:uncharacterized protein KL928_001012 [Ogataea angusta]KAG7820928.1 hypothetical protein KL928_001012 [Ogataea angusta]KAG7826372.1 hypothetical protein KL909_000424 [Ogataea angusta]KAG7843120.1 hypothetical protein KL942_000216 [Ogataea angusta]KAG7851338.1 hypothetical protein KL941_001007 [Ogataea angusta]KAG7852728.1 hypothetical protein KL940_000429 [Ogataea angusta]
MSRDVPLGQKSPANKFLSPAGRALTGRGCKTRGRLARVPGGSTCDEFFNKFFIFYSIDISASKYLPSKEYVCEAQQQDSRTESRIDESVVSTL